MRIVCIRSFLLLHTQIQAFKFPANGCPNLCFLEIIHGPGLDKNAAELLCGGNGLSSLTTLVLNFTPSTHIAMSHLLNCCTRLQRLDLHITLQTYFSSNEASIRENMSAYEQIVRNLKVRNSYDKLLIPTDFQNRNWRNKRKVKMFSIYLNITPESNSENKLNILSCATKNNMQVDSTFS